MGENCREPQSLQEDGEALSKTGLRQGKHSTAEIIVIKLSMHKIFENKIQQHINDMCFVAFLVCRLYFGALLLGGSSKMLRKYQNITEEECSSEPFQ
jgi:hypothetical protein